MESRGAPAWGWVEEASKAGAGRAQGAGWGPEQEEVRVAGDGGDTDAEGSLVGRPRKGVLRRSLPPAAPLLGSVLLALSRALEGPPPPALCEPLGSPASVGQVRVWGGCLCPSSLRAGCHGWVRALPAPEHMEPMVADPVWERRPLPAEGSPGQDSRLHPPTTPPSAFPPHPPTWPAPSLIPRPGSAARGLERLSGRAGQLGRCSPGWPPPHPPAM